MKSRPLPVVKINDLPNYEPFYPNASWDMPKGAFSDPLALAQLLGRQWNGRTVRLKSRFVLHYITELLEFISIMDEGFVTNGGSIPTLFHNVINPMGSTIIGFIPHDQLYGTQALPRNVVDWIMYELLRYSSLPNWKAWCAWQAVDKFGGKAYSDCDRCIVDGHLVQRCAWQKDRIMIPDFSRLHSRTAILRVEGQFSKFADPHVLKPSFTFEEAKTISLADFDELS